MPLEGQFEVEVLLMVRKLIAAVLLMVEALDEPPQSTACWMQEERAKSKLGRGPES